MLFKYYTTEKENDLNQNSDVDNDDGKMAKFFKMSDKSFINIEISFVIFVLYIVTEKDQDYVLYNNKNSVWICKHTMDDQHVCTYLACKGCFDKKLANKETKNGKIKQSINTVDYDDNQKLTTVCDHTSSVANLDEFQYIKGYFSENYIKKKLENSCHYPTKCLECDKPVREQKIDLQKSVCV